MRRIAAGSLVACAVAMIIAACGGSSPMTPTPPAGGGGGGTVTNTPPQITSITVSDTRVEAGTPVTLTAVVQDTETPVANLTYAWSAPTGTFSGTGAIVTWTPGTDAVTPGDFVVTLTVTERYASGTSTLENKVTGTVTAHVNNSPKELADLSLRFLGNFANSSVPPATCVSEFSNSCRGKQNELDDITDNRHDFLILASTLRATSVELPPAGTTATVHTFCAFTSRVITHDPHSGGCLADPSSCKFDTVQSVQGDCWTTNVYENGRWWLCTSRFTGLGSLTGFARAFFGIRGPEIP
jgi:PKD domain